MMVMMMMMAMKVFWKCPGSFLHRVIFGFQQLLPSMYEFIIVIILCVCVHVCVCVCVCVCECEHACRCAHVCVCDAQYNADTLSEVQIFYLL